MADSRHYEDLLGQKFGRLTVIEYSGKRVRHEWKCKCECGNIITTRANALKTGNTTSCGCVKKEQASVMMTTHGKSKTVEYSLYNDMIKRCYNKNQKHYRHYGGRGINVCKRWLESFLNFLEDMGLRPSDKHSIDRRDNDDNYSPENCYWATPEQQANNKRNNRYITFNGKTMTAPQWARELGVKACNIYSRIYKGLSDEDILKDFL